MNLQNKQIASQLEGKTIVKLFFTNAIKGKEPQSSKISLYAQQGKFWISWGLDSIRITKEKYTGIVSQFTSEKEFNTDPEILRTEESYYSFFKKHGFTNVD